MKSTKRWRWKRAATPGGVTDLAAAVGRRKLSICVSLAVGVAPLFAASSARAQDAAAKATSVQLFDEAEKLMAEGRFKEACPKFAASHRLDPQLERACPKSRRATLRALLLPAFVSVAVAAVACDGVSDVDVTIAGGGGQGGSSGATGGGGKSGSGGAGRGRRSVRRRRRLRAPRLGRSRVGRRLLAMKHAIGAHHGSPNRHR